MPLEYRVRWQREGRSPSFRIYQSGEAAVRRMRAIQAVDQVKGETECWADMPDLVGPPELQVREVGEWRPNDYQPEASEYDRKSMREQAAWKDPAPATETGVPF